MKVRPNRVLAGLTVAAVAGGVLVGLAATGAVAGGTAPPWEPDSNSLGGLTFYNSAGAVVTGGTNLNHLFDYAAADTTDPATGDTKASLAFANPQPATPTGSWFVGNASTSTPFPNATAPAPVSGTAATNPSGVAFTNPMNTVAASGANLTSFISTVTANTAAGYANVYQVRLTTANDSGYWESDIVVSGSSWSVEYAAPAGPAGAAAGPVPGYNTSTTGNVVANPAATAQTGTPVTLKSTVAFSAASPANSGTVQFFDGTTALGTPQAVTDAAPTATITYATPVSTEGTHSFTATFVPNGGVDTVGSTSATPTTYKVTPPLINTSTALAVNPTTGSTAFTPVVLTSDITEADSPTTTGEAGSVTFYNTPSGGSPTALGTVSTNDGTVGEYKFTDSSLSAGTYSFTAVFTPTNSAYGGSTSAAVADTILASTCEGVPAAGGATCTDTQNISVSLGAGSITITTPYTASNPYVLPPLTLNAAGTLLTTSAQFPKAGDPLIAVTSSLTGDPNWTVSVTDSNLTGTTSSANVINGENLGLTSGTEQVTSPPFPGTIAFTDNPAANGVAPANTGSAGLKGGPHTFAQSSGGGNGTAQMYGTLTLNAPTSTVADTYTGTITFSVA